MPARLPDHSVRCMKTSLLMTSRRFCVSPCTLTEPPSGRVVTHHAGQLAIGHRFGNALAGQGHVKNQRVEIAAGRRETAALLDQELRQRRPVGTKWSWGFALGKVSWYLAQRVRSGRNVSGRQPGAAACITPGSRLSASGAPNTALPATRCRHLPPQFRDVVGLDAAVHLQPDRLATGGLVGVDAGTRLAQLGQGAGMKLSARQSRG
jgi:hypothetical protein